MIPDKYLLQTLFATLAFVLTTFFSLFNNTLLTTSIRAGIAFLLFFFIGGFVRWLIEINIETALIHVNKKEETKKGLDSIDEDLFLGQELNIGSENEFDFMTDIDDINYDSINSDNLDFDPEELARALRDFSKD